MTEPRTAACPQPAPRARTHAVCLATLPDDIVFPSDLVERIWFEPNTRRLVCRGFMSKATFDRLVTLHNDHSYQRALENLFQLCVFEDPVPPRDWLPRWLTSWNKPRSYRVKDSA